MLAGRFGARTAALVAAVTNPAWEPGRDKHEQYREHVLAARQASPWARVIKASDFTDNAVGVINTTGPKLPELARKYGRLVPALRVLILRPDTPLEDDVKGTIAARPGAARRHQARPPRRSSASAWSCARRETGDSRRRNGLMACMTLPWAPVATLIDSLPLAGSGPSQRL